MLLRAGIPAEIEVTRLWAEEPAAVPSALEALAATGSAIAFAERLPEEAALQISRAVAHVHGLEALASALADAMRQVAAEPAATAPAAATSAALRRPAPPASRVERPAARAPWHDVVPEAASPALPRAAALLLGVALTLRRAPPHARRATYAREVRRWLDAATGSAPPERIDLGGVTERAVPANLRSTESERVREAAMFAAAATPPAVPASVRTDVSTAPQPPDATMAGALPPTHEPPHAAAESASAAPTSTPPKSRETTRSSHVEPEPETPALAATTITELGGVFMLLNVALALGLYGDFTQPLARGLALDPWDFVVQMGRELLGPRSRRRDPVWQLLARLAAPTRRITPPRDWRIPPGWLEPFEAGEAPWRYSTARGRMRIRHPAGFPVLDVPLAGDPHRQLERAARRYGAQRYVRAALPEQVWLERIADYFRARIALALGVRESRIPTVLLRRRARVLVTDTRVDIVIQLAEHAIEVRLAGLDRDPGWIPAAGRDVRFHFE